LPSGTAPEPPAAGNSDHAPRVGDDSDIDRMVAAAGRLWHRFVDAIARAQKQVLNNKSYGKTQSRWTSAFLSPARPREGGDPVVCTRPWMPAFAAMSGKLDRYDRIAV
jgi:hypothetical protein